MCNEIFIINVFVLICITSAEFNLNSLNTTTKSLDTFNQTKITLNYTWDDYKKAQDDDPIMPNEMQQQQYKAKETGRLLNITTTTTVNFTRYLTNEKPLKFASLIKQLEAIKYRQRITNTPNSYHYRTKFKFNKRNNDNDDDDYFNLNNKLKTITTYSYYDKNNAKAMQQNVNNVQESPGDHMIRKLLKGKGEGEEEEEKVQNNKNSKAKYYDATANGLSKKWLGHLPQYTQQMQLLLQQQQQLQKQQQKQSAAWLLPHEYHHLTDYRFVFNAERQTQFYLHTLTKPNNFPTIAIKQAKETAIKQAKETASLKQHNSHKYPDEHDYYNKSTTDDSDRRTMANLNNSRVLNVVTDTIGAVFGVNTRPVATIPGIRIDEIELYNRLSLRQSRFNPFNPCRILIHGWLGNSKAGIYNTLVPAYLKLYQGAYNVFTVDWGRGAVADYITASYKVKPVGIVVAKFIDFLHQESGIPFESIHVIGFSMGAHVAGIAGKYVQTGRLPVIYGLDPALPLFRYENVNERLDTTDANYVEVIHTSVGSYGYDHPLGHVDFYINFGYNQPGCFFNECSHFRAFQVFAEILTNEMLEGVGCPEELWWDMIKNKRCLRDMGKRLRMGIEGLERAEFSLRRGVYYVTTNSQAPYKIY